MELNNFIVICVNILIQTKMLDLNKIIKIVAKSIKVKEKILINFKNWRF